MAILKTKFIILISLILISISATSQEDNLSPVLKNATIINDEGHIKLLWEYPDSIISDIYIYRNYYNIGDWVLGEWNVVSNTNNWIDTNTQANDSTHVYLIKIKLPGEGDFRASNRFNTTHASINLDTCNKKSKIKWTRHIKQKATANEPWNDSIKIKEWNIWRSKDNSEFKKIGINQSSDTTFTDPDIEYDRAYKYYIEGVLQSDTSIKSKSNRVSVNTDMPDEPEYINLDSLSTRNGDIHLSFSIDEDSELHRYVLLRSQGVRKGAYDTIKSYNQPGPTIRYIDESVDPTRNLYYYHLAAMNQCGALTTRSDTLSNLLLTVTQQNLTHQVAWNNITYLPRSSISYDVYRKGGDTHDFNQQKTLFQSPFLDDEIQTYIKDTVSSEFCYYVTARIDHPGGQQSFITSFKRCVYVKPQPFIPNAFIPNAQRNVNRGFRPEFTFIPQHYLLIIYDRSGRKVFQSGNPEDKWEGKIQGGQKAPAGTYTYYLEVKNPGDPLIRKRGEVTLIYR